MTMPDAPTRMTAERLAELRTSPLMKGESSYRIRQIQELIAEIDALASLLDRTTAEKVNAVSKCIGINAICLQLHTMHRALSADNAALHTDCRVMADALRGGGFGVRWTSGDDPEAVKAAIARHGSTTP